MDQEQPGEYRLLSVPALSSSVPCTRAPRIWGLGCYCYYRCCRSVHARAVLRAAVRCPECGWGRRKGIFHRESCGRFSTPPPGAGIEQLDTRLFEHLLPVFLPIPNRGHRDFPESRLLSVDRGMISAKMPSGSQTPRRANISSRSPYSMLRD